MYLSKITLDQRSKSVWGVLKNPYSLHAFVMRAFPENSGERVLFRMEPERGAEGRIVKVLAQSAVEPDWSPQIAQHKGSVTAQSKKVHMELVKNQVLRFRLRANPSVKKDGKRLGIFDEDKQLDWLRRKGAGKFNIQSILVLDEGFSRWEKTIGSKKHKLTIYTILFEGILEVLDAGGLIETIESGIGSAKGFGCGLLSVAKP